MADGCDYQGYEFGAHYLDSVCVNGYLWDADSGNAPGELDVGGDIPCPQCNHDEFLVHNEDNIIEEGYNAFALEMEPDACPYPPEKGEEHQPGDFAVFRFLWLKGYAQAVAEKTDEKGQTHE